MAISATIRRNWFKGLLLGYVLYASAFIYSSSVVVGGERYFLLLDDAMISMTYARNLARGQGAVWYPAAERVQGYSNPSWMLYMAAIHLLPLSPAKMALPIQSTGVVLIGATLFFVKRIGELIAAEQHRCKDLDDRRRGAGSCFALVPFVAVLLTACYFPLNNWSLRGMEVGVLAFGTSLAVWAALECATGRQYQWWLLPWLGLLTTVRLDAAVASSIIVLWLAWAVPARRWQVLLAGGGVIAFFVLAELALQRAYYGDWLPNSYYLKLTGIPIGRRVVWGVYVLWCFLAGFGLWLIILAGLYVALGRSKNVSLLVAVIAGQVFYSVYVGGDSWEWWGGANRYLCVAIPLLFILLALAFAMCGDWVAALRSPGRPAVANGVVLALSAAALLQVNGYNFRKFNSLAQCVQKDDPPELAAHAATLVAAINLREATSPNARVAVVWAGILPYFSERPAVDLLGKNDRRIARGPDRPLDPPPLDMFDLAPVPYFWPGHSKRDFQYSVASLLPDVVQAWYGMEEIETTLDERYEHAEFGALDFFVKKNSPEIDFATHTAKSGKAQSAGQ